MCLTNHAQSQLLITFQTSQEQRRMVKSRMTVADCMRMAAEVNALLQGSWVQNIYTAEDPKTFLFKLTGRGDKYMLLLESGIRFHPTEFVREKSEMPSGFAMKLRKHVRGRKLEYCRQVGLDRVVDFAFGKGTQHHHVVLELYAGGNVVLTNETGLILTILRPYTLEEGNSQRVAVGEKYPFDLALEGPRALLFSHDSVVVSPEMISNFLELFLSQIKQDVDEEGLVIGEDLSKSNKKKKPPENSQPQGKKTKKFRVFLFR